MRCGTTAHRFDKTDPSADYGALCHLRGRFRRSRSIWPPGGIRWLRSDGPFDRIWLGALGRGSQSRRGRWLPGCIYRRSYRRSGRNSGGDFLWLPGRVDCKTTRQIIKKKGFPEIGEALLIHRLRKLISRRQIDLIPVFPGKLNITGGANIL